MRHGIGALLKYRIWLAVMLAFNLLFGVLLWLQNSEGFLRLFPVMLMGSLGIYVITAFAAGAADKRREEAVMAMLENPEIEIQRQAEIFFTGTEWSIIETVGNLLREKNDMIRQQAVDTCEYEEYIESWAHEVKTPLALMTFVLDNRRDELSPDLYYRLEYARTKIQEDVERILYYARLKSSHRDYLFEPVPLRDICREVLEEYAVLLEERKIQVMDEIGDEQVITDGRGLSFCIRQVMSNAVKYAASNASGRWIRLSSVKETENGKIILSIRDNGVGVKNYDLPFIFDKGFTGDKGTTNKTATGMGLYLTAQVAGQLKIEIQTPVCPEGFEIWFVFRY